MNINNKIAMWFKHRLGDDNWTQKTEFEFVAKKDSKANKVLRETLGITAITLGDYVFFAFGTYTKVRRAHEQEHVKQYDKWGVFFLPAYGFASLISFVTKGNWYKNNEFEEDARKAEKDVEDKNTNA